MEKLPRRHFVVISLMLFSMFFGAGNLIFPPFLGQMAGSSFLPAILGFLSTAVGFPILGILVISRFGELDRLTSRVHPRFAGIFGVLMYLTIGPCLAIPRAASMPYEMAIAAYLPEGFSFHWGLLIFSVVFFGLCYIISRNPSKVVDTLGKFLTPALLLLIVLTFIMAFIKPMSGASAPTGGYAQSAFSTGFMEGYLTMDTIAALNFGILVANSIRGYGIRDEKVIARSSIGIGVLAGIILGLVYTMLGWLGAMGSSQFSLGANGAVILTDMAWWFFGPIGAVILAAIFLLACMTTCVGLLACCSEYFASFGKLSYDKWLLILTVWSVAITNFGLTNILRFSGPLLNILYPVVIVLIVLGLMDRFYEKNRLIYPLTVALTLGVSLVQELTRTLHLSVPVLGDLVARLPLFEMGLAWVPAAVLAAMMGLALGSYTKKQA